MNGESSASRLARMRESQRKLRTQRKNELEDLKEKYQLLLQENERLKNESYKNKQELSMGLSLFDTEITSGQLEKLITEVDVDDGNPQYDVIPIDEFIKQGNFEDHPCLFMDGRFILQEICIKNMACMTRALTNYSSIALKDTPLRFIKTYGLGVMKYHLSYIRQIAKQGMIPKDWLNDDRVLPKGALSIVEVLHYICNNAASKTLNSYVLCAFVSRFSFACDQGLAMFEHDLLRCIEYANSSNFDEAYLLGTVDESLCPAGVFPKSFV